MTKRLSPAALAVMDAVVKVYPAFPDEVAVAAIRAAVDQAHPKAHIEDIDYIHQSYVDGWKDALDVILTIADELTTND